jgi:hypothetical protein
MKPMVAQIDFRAEKAEYSVTDSGGKDMKATSVLDSMGRRICLSHSGRSIWTRIPSDSGFSANFP